MAYRKKRSKPSTKGRKVFKGKQGGRYVLRRSGKKVYRVYV